MLISMQLSVPWNFAVWTTSTSICIYSWALGWTQCPSAWEACVAARKAGKVKSIGISTFGVFHMQELFDSWESPPAVHQVCTIQNLLGIALHSFMTRTEIVKFCRGHGIVLEVYSLP